MTSFTFLMFAFSIVGVGTQLAEKDSEEQIPSITTERSEAAITTARRHLACGDIQPAENTLTDAIKEDSQNGKLFLERGDVRMQYGTREKTKLAIGDYSQAISRMVRGGNHIAYRNRGNAHAMIQNWIDALTDYEMSLKINSEDPVTYCYRGQLWYLTGQLGEAEADFHQALEKAPNSELALNNLGYLAQERGDLELALTYYSKAIQAAPNNPDFLRNRGHLYFRIGEFNRALEDQNKAVLFSPRNIWTLIDRGDTKAAIGDLVGALCDYSKALEMDETNAGFKGAFSKRAEVHKRLGSAQKAIRDLENAKKYDNSNNP